MPEDKNVVLHPTVNGVLDTSINIFPKTKRNNIIDNEGNTVQLQNALTVGNGLNRSEFENNNNLVFELTTTIAQTIFNMIYPIGSIYTAYEDSNVTNPNYFGFGTWERIQECFLYAAKYDGTSHTTQYDYKVGDSGGSKDTVLIKHNHYFGIENGRTAEETFTHSHNISLADFGYKIKFKGPNAQAFVSSLGDTTIHTDDDRNTYRDSIRLYNPTDTNLHDLVIVTDNIIKPSYEGRCTTYYYDNQSPQQDLIMIEYTDNAVYTQPNTYTHAHYFSISSYTAQAGSADSGINKNMPPYRAVVVWRRIS